MLYLKVSLIFWFLILFKKGKVIVLLSLSKSRERFKCSWIDANGVSNAFLISLISSFEVIWVIFLPTKRYAETSTSSIHLLLGGYLQRIRVDCRPYTTYS